MQAQAIIVTKNEKSNLQRFYEGWPHFSTIYVKDGYAEFGVATPSRAAGCIEKAQQRIAELKLPLEVKAAAKLSNTFMVKEKGASHVA